MHPAAAACFRFDDVLVDTATFSAVRGGQKLTLEPRAFQVLRYLVEHPGRLVTKEELIQEVWGGAFVTDNALTRVVAQLRRELGDTAKGARYIETVPTQGYRFVAAVETMAAPPSPPASQTLGPSTSLPGRRWGLLLTGSALLLAGAAYLAGLGTRVPATGTGGHSRQFTSGPGLQMWSSFSPDGNLLVYASDKTGRFELYTKPVTPGGRETPLTEDGQQNIMPAWSPDGKWIAYHAVVQNALRIVPATGGTPRTLSDFGLDPAWSPDSRQVVFRSGVYLSPIAADFGSLHGTRLYLADLEGGTPRPLTSEIMARGGQISPCWPAGSDSLYYLSASAHGSSTVWRLRLGDGTRPEAVRRSEDYAWLSLACAPGGRELYLSEASPNYEFSVASLTVPEGGKPRTIQQTGVLMPRALAVSATGQLAYTLVMPSSNLYRLPMNPRTLEASGPPEELTHETASRVSLPAISPDGVLVAYYVRRVGVQSDIYVIPARGGEPEQITTNPASEVMPNWLADSRTILFTRKPGEHASLVRVKVGDARTQEVIPLKDGPRMAGVSRDGTHMLFQTWTNGRLGVAISSLDGKPAAGLTPAGQDIGYPSWSGDGKMVAAELFDKDFTHLVVMDSQGRGFRRLTSERGQFWPYGWAPDNGHIAVAVMRGGVWGLYAVSASTGSMKTLLPPGPPRTFVRYPSWSPRGDMIVYERSESSGNLYLLDPP